MAQIIVVGKIASHRITYLPLSSNISTSLLTFIFTIKTLNRLSKPAVAGIPTNPAFSALRNLAKALLFLIYYKLSARAPCGIKYVLVNPFSYDLLVGD